MADPFQPLIDSENPAGLGDFIIGLDNLNRLVAITALRGNGNPDDDKTQNAANLQVAIQRFGDAFQRNRVSNQKYKNVVTTGLNSIKVLIIQIGYLLNNISDLIEFLRSQNNPGVEGRVEELTAQRNALTEVIREATNVLNTLITPQGDLNGAANLNPREIAHELTTIIEALTKERVKAEDVLDRNNSEQLQSPIMNILPGPPQEPSRPAEIEMIHLGQPGNRPRPRPPQPGPRVGGKMRKTKRHQKMSRKINKKKSKKTANKTAKKGKKMRGGYSYGKSKRRRGRSSPTATAPSSLSSASKNIILF